MTLGVHSSLFDDDLDGLSDRMDVARVHSMRTTADAGLKNPNAIVTEVHSATTNLS